MILFIVEPIEVLPDLVSFLNRRICIQRINEKEVELSTVIVGRGRTTNFVFPKLVKIKGCILGLLKGEMLSSNKSTGQFVFANSNPIAVNLILDCLKTLGIRINDITITLELSCKGIKNLKISLEKSIDFWINNTKITKNDIQRIKFRKEFKPDITTGNIQLRFSNKIFRAFIQTVLIKSISLAKADKNLLRFEKLPQTFTLSMMKNVFKLSTFPRDTKNNFLKLGFLEQVSNDIPRMFKLTERAKDILRY